MKKSALAGRQETARREMAELCRLGPCQATRLLSRLVEEGCLNRHGERKGVGYKRGPRI